MKKTALLAHGLILAAAFCCRAEDRLPLVKSGEHYQIRAKTHAEAEGRGKLLLEIVVTDGWKLNRKAPLLVKLEAGAGLQLKKTSWTARDAARIEDKLCRLEIPYFAKTTTVLELRFKFVICTDTLCQQKKFSLSLKLGG